MPELTGIEEGVVAELAETYGYSMANLFRKALVAFLQAEKDEDDQRV